MFSYFLLQLNKGSDPVFNQIYAIKPSVPEIIVSEPEPDYTPVTELTLSMLLAEEIEQKKLKVTELVQRSIVTIQGDNLFGSGSTNVKRSIIPILYRIAESLNQLSGEVLITGHSDNRPIKSSRFPSNWHLSKARAEAVSTLIKRNLTEQDRTVTEGRSDLNPIAPNNTRAGRAKNRRVEITLLK
jgi:type VI secretion system protein ImpK